MRDKGETARKAIVCVSKLSKQGGFDEEAGEGLTPWSESDPLVASALGYKKARQNMLVCLPPRFYQSLLLCHF